MPQVNWIKGELNPPNSGEYYIIIEAQEDINDFKKGDVEVTSDGFDAKRKEWDSIGKENPYWKVLCWADILRPSIPNDLVKITKVYFGHKVGADNG